MRKTLATLAVLAAGAVTLGTVASPASADDPNVTYLQGGTMSASRILSCQTQYKTGVYGQYGAWGYFIDGCTVKLDCPVNTGLYNTRYCDILSYSFIDTKNHRGDRVTMNSRIRRFDAAGNTLGWQDKSCDSSSVGSADRCEVNDTSWISPGQSATVQCNGVRQWRLYDGNSAKDYCSIQLRYR
jgi:hypothetical protein